MSVVDGTEYCEDLSHMVGLFAEGVPNQNIICYAGDVFINPSYRTYLSIFPTRPYLDVLKLVDVESYPMAWP